MSSSRRHRRAARIAPYPTTAITCLAMVLLVGSVPTVAQTTERFRGRLAPLPVDYATVAGITGEGVVTAELRGNELTLTARFKGLSTPATVAHMHRAPKALRGPVAFPLDLGRATSREGQLTNTITLSDEQVAELRNERYYLQIHTEGNTAGEIRGWLLPQKSP